MKPTPEQYAIIHSKGNAKINAVAGSGKTTTIIEYAQAQPSNARILYLAFNKSVKLEAAKRFEEKGLTNVRVETAHSLAYKQIVYRYRYQIRPQGYKIHELSQILKLRVRGEKLTKYILANHISNFIAYFCNSSAQKVKDLNYLDIVKDGKSRIFALNFYDKIEQQTRLFLAKMNNGETAITHDFYLKKFQLSQPILPFDYILFDEGQDASPAMLDVFFKQKATKVIVGDTHQQIYGWRFAINSLEKADFKNFTLSTSFRFRQDIANLAMGILKWKSHLEEEVETNLIKGKGKTRARKTKAILARTNLGLLLKAITYITNNPKAKDIYFEGNINSYTYASEGASLYDVLNLFNGKNHLIRDKMIKEMNEIEDLENYIEKTEDVQLGMMVGIVKEYGNEIPQLLKTLKDKHLSNEDKHKAKMVFSTVHRCKGMEYDEVELVNDFINEKRIEKLVADYKKEKLDLSKINEEINLLYVAVTRAKYKLKIPESLLPKDFMPSLNIELIKVVKEQDETECYFEEEMLMDYTPSKKQSITPEEPIIIRRWSSKLDEELQYLFNKGKSIKDIAIHLGRTENAVRARISKLQLRKAMLEED